MNGDLIWHLKLNSYCPLVMSAVTLPYTMIEVYNMSCHSYTSVNFTSASYLILYCYLLFMSHICVACISLDIFPTAWKNFCTVDERTTSQNWQNWCKYCVFYFLNLLGKLLCEYSTLLCTDICSCPMFETVVLQTILPYTIPVFPSPQTSGNVECLCKILI